jgi:hypothetical protein
MDLVCLDNSMKIIYIYGPHDDEDGDDGYGGGNDDVD